MRDRLFHFPKHTEDVELYLSDLAKLPVLSDAQRAEAFARAQAGDMDARETLVLAHLRLVVRIALQYTGYGLPLADMIAEGNLGLLRAVELYDTRFGTAFETYASVWIKQRIHRAITAQAKAVRIPVWRSQRLRKLDRLHSDLNAELGRDATLQELGERLGMSEEALASISQDRTLVESIDAMEAESQSSAPLLDATPLPGERLLREEMQEEIYACLDALDDAELQVLSMKFGLVDEEPQSYREMAPRLGRNREWIRKAGERALAKVRTSMQEMASIPRKIVAQRRRNASKRLEKLKKSTVTLSVQNTMLIPWIENFIPIL